jgi:hypothetical protein
MVAATAASAPAAVMPERENREMVDTFVVYDEANRPLEYFAGPHRLAAWKDFPAGWSIEWFSGDVSRGCVQFWQVQRFAAGGDLVRPEEYRR